MKLVQLTNANNTRITINFDNVVYFIPHDKEETAKTVDEMKGGMNVFDLFGLKSELNDAIDSLKNANTLIKTIGSEKAGCDLYVLETYDEVKKLAEE